jgi:hypothetical protein
MGKTVEQQIEAAIRGEVDPVVAGVHSVAEDLRDRLDGHEQAVQAHQEAQHVPRNSWPKWPGYISSTPGRCSRKTPTRLP